MIEFKRGTTSSYEGLESPDPNILYVTNDEGSFTSDESVDTEMYVGKNKITDLNVVETLRAVLDNIGWSYPESQ